MLSIVMILKTEFFTAATILLAPTYFLIACRENLNETFPCK